MSYDQGKLFGTLSRLVVQSGYFLEMLSTGECGQFAQKKHDADKDLADVMKEIPSEWLNKGVNVRAEIGSRAKEQGARDLKNFDNHIKKSGTGLELRCGILLGIGSTTYFQARKEWANFLKLPPPEWLQP